MRARRRSEAEWQVHIRDGVRALIDALVLCARGLTPKDEAGWRGAARKLAGDAAAGFKFTSKGTYGKLFDMGGSTNSHQYLGPNARRRITDNHLEKIAAFLGALFPSLVVVDAQGPDAWVKWLDRANQAVGGVGGLAQEPTAAVVAEVQRRAVRASLQDKVIAGLEELGRVAIVGMSGTGKTVLARQVLADWCEPENPAITIDARSVLSSALASASPRAPDAAADQSTLSGVIVREIAARLLATTPYSDGREWFENQKNALLDAYPIPKDDRVRREHRRQIAFIEAIHAKAGWQDFLRAVVEHAAGVHHTALLQRVAAILRPAARHLVVFVDDAFSFPVGGAVDALFAAEHGREGPCLLVTSVEKETLARLSCSRVIDLDASPDYDATVFARDIVTVWSASERQVLDEAALADHRRSIFADRSSAAIEMVISKVGRHPLAVAALAAAWRIDHGMNAAFWSEATEALDADPYQTLFLRDDRAEFDERHRRVLKALRFAWSLFDPVTQERFLDLTLTPPNQSPDKVVYDAYWQRKVGDGRKRLAPAFARPLERLADKSLLQKTPDGAGFILHTLHRWMIEAELGEAGVEERHRSFLRFCGLIDGDDRVDLDAPDRFQAVSSGETLIMPGGEVGEAHRQPVGRYLVRHLLHHLRQLGSGDAHEENLHRVLTKFAFLEALLAIPSSSDAGRPGNVEALLGAFDGIGSAPAVQLGRTLRMAGPFLGVDKRRLAAEICARVSPDLHPLQFELCADARRAAPHEALCARFPFLPNGEGALIATLPIHAGRRVFGFRFGRPTVLSFWRDALGLWDVATGQGAMVPVRHASIAHAEWVRGSAETTSIVSWSDHEICVWDTIEGVLIARYCLTDEPNSRHGEPASLRLYPRSVRKGEQPARATISWATTVAGSDGLPLVFFWTRNEIFVWDYLSGSPPDVIYFGEAEITWVEPACYPSVGALLIVECRLWERNTVVLWDVEAREPRWSRDADNGAWTADQVSPSLLTWDASNIHFCNALDGTAQHLLSTTPSHEVAHAIYPPNAWGVYIKGARLFGRDTDTTLLFWTPFEIWRWNIAKKLLVVRRCPLCERSGRSVRRFAIETPDGEVVQANAEPGFYARAWRHADGSPCEIEVGEEDDWFQDAEVVEQGFDTPAIITTYGWLQIWEASGLTLPKANNRIGREPTQINWVSIREKQALLLSYYTYDYSIRALVIDAHSGDAMVGQPITWPYRRVVGGNTEFRWFPKLPVGPRLLALVSGTLEIWDPETGERSPQFGIQHQSPIRGIDCSDPAGGPVRALSYSCDSIKLWELPDLLPSRPDELYFDANHSIKAARWIDLDRTPHVLAHSDTELRLWDLQTPKAPLRIAGEGRIEHAYWIEQALSGAAILTTSTEIISLWDPRSGKALAKSIRPLVGDNPGSRRLDAVWMEDTPDGPSILSWSETRVRLWNAASGQLRFELTAWRGERRQTLQDEMLRPTRDRLRLRWESRPGGTPAILVICYDEIRFWDPWNNRTAEPLQHAAEISDATWIRDANGRLGVVSCAWDRSVCVWDAASGKERKRFEFGFVPLTLTRAPQGHSGPAAVAVDFGDGTVGVFDIDLG